LADARAGRSWQVGDGRLAIYNRGTEVSLELGLTLLDGAVPAQATVKIVTDKAGGAARLTATVDKVAAADLAAMSPPLAWLGFVRAPISGRLDATLGETGALSGLTAELGLDAGTLEPGEGARAIAFDRAAMSLSFDPKAARIRLTDLTVKSASLKLRASGHSDLLGPDGSPMPPGALPDAFLGQFAFSEVMVDPEGLFEVPVRFSEGALDLRLRLDPFRLDIGQLALVEANERLLLSGNVAAAAGGCRPRPDQH
jgi:hypothetical protein